MFSNANRDCELLDDHRVTCTWVDAYGLVSNLANLVGARSLVEIGVAYGYHAEFLLDTVPKASYIGVDPYSAAGWPDTGLIAESKRLFNETDNQRGLDRLYEAVAANLRKFGKRAALIREKSAAAAARIPDQSIDLIYVDGDHSYEAVLQDLGLWWNKVNHRRGVICGDDIGWPGVRQACDEFFKAKSLSYRFAMKNGHEGLPVWYYDFSGTIK